jgi:cytochrome c556
MFATISSRREVQMRGSLVVVALGAAAVLAGTAAVAQGDVIAERRAGLKRMGEHMQAMNAVVDSKGDVRPLAATVDDMVAWYRTMPSRFPPGSDRGDTRAQPALWNERANFETINTNMVNQLQILRTAAASGDPAAFASAYGQTGQTCGTCHRPYRQRTS